MKNDDITAKAQKTIHVLLDVIAEAAKGVSSGTVAVSNLRELVSTYEKVSETARKNAGIQEQFQIQPQPPTRLYSNTAAAQSSYRKAQPYDEAIGSVVRQQSKAQMPTRQPMQSSIGFG